MNILAIDTATHILSVSLSAPGGRYRAEIDAGLRHSELLMELVDGLLESAGMSPGELEAVACMKGPGSFTGLRIGFSAAKGIALSLGIPLFSVPTLDCMAYPHSCWPGVVIPAMDAKKKCYFSALYRQGERIGDYLDAPPAQILSLIPAGERVFLTGPDAAPLFEAFNGHIEPDSLCLDPVRNRGKAHELLEMVLKGGILRYRENVENAGPLYLRKSDAELSFNIQ